MSRLACMLISLAFSIGIVWAGPNEDCIDAQDMDVKIQGCTTQIQKGGSLRDRAQHYNNRCLGYHGKGDYKRAIADCTRAIELTPQDAFAYNNRCLNYNEMGDFDRAIADCTKSIALKNSELHIPYRNRGDAHAGKGNYDTAISDFVRAIELNPSYDLAHQSLAAVRKLREQKLNPATKANSPVEIVPFVPHSGWVQSVSFSPDGTLTLSGGQDGKVKVWEAATGRLIRTLRGHGRGVLSVTFAPDGKRAISGGAFDVDVKLWNVATGEFIRRYEGHTKGVKAVAFSPDGKRIASASFDNTVVVWDPNSDRPLLTFRGHVGGVSSVAFSPDGLRVVSGAGSSIYPKRDDNTAKVWDVATGRIIQSLQHSGEVLSAVFSADGSRILTGSEDKSLRLWDASNGRLIRTLSGHSLAINSVAFSTNGTRLYSGSLDGIYVWDASTGASLPALGGRWKGAWSIAISPDGRRLLAGTSNDEVKLWDLSTGMLLNSAGYETNNVGRPGSVAFSPDASRLVSGSDSALRLWDVPGSARTIRGDHRRLAYSPDGTLLLAGGRNSLKLVDAATGQRIRAIEGVANEVEAVAFSPDGKRVLAGLAFGDDLEKGKIKMWDTATGRLLTTFRGHGGGTNAVAFRGVNAVAFTPDGAHVVTGGSNDGVPQSGPKGNGKLRFWDPASGKLIRSIDAHYFEVTALAISPDGSRIVTGSSYDPVSQGVLVTTIQTMRIWDARSGQMLHSVGPHATVNAVAFSPDGKQVIAGSDDNQLMMWDVAGGQLVRHFDGHSGAVTAVAFSRDGTRILSTSGDRTVRIWDAAKGELLATLMADEQSWLAIMPAGFFATSSPTDAKTLTIARGLELYNVNQMYQALYDPDLVREKLVGDPDGEVKAATGALDLGKVIDSGQPPDVALVSPSSGSTSSEEVVTVSARLTDRGGGIGRVEWRVNGITAAVAAKAGGSGSERTVSQTLALEPGQNVIEVIAYNERNILASLPLSTSVSWAAPADQPKPKLFVIAVGINQYGDTLFKRLSHAVADARAFGAAMKAAGEGLYADVDVTTVLDAEATVDNLERIVDAVGARMHPRDVFVFLAAAHGKSENGRFHLIPHDYRTDAPGTLAEKAVGQDRLQDWFANRIKARRGLILLDTCESGALVASRASGIDLASSDAALGRLNEATGRPVLTAAAADQAALEGYRGHGVFTYALLDALVNGDTNGNGQIELSELRAHIQTLTPRLSQELGGRRGEAVPVAKSRAAQALGVGKAPIASRLVQKPRTGSRGEDFALVRRLSALPASAQ